jgi:hypothetical protein
MDSLVPAERSTKEASVDVRADVEIRKTVTKERYHHGNKHVEKTITVEAHIRAIRPQEDDHHRERSERRDPERSKNSERHDRPDRRESSARRETKEESIRASTLASREAKKSYDLDEIDSDVSNWGSWSGIMEREPVFSKEAVKRTHHNAKTSIQPNAAKKQ